MANGVMAAAGGLLMVWASWWLGNGGSPFAWMVLDVAVVVAAMALWLAAVEWILVLDAAGLAGIGVALLGGLVMVLGAWSGLLSLVLWASLALPVGLLLFGWAAVRHRFLPPDLRLLPLASGGVLLAITLDGWVRHWPPTRGVQWHVVFALAGALVMSVGLLLVQRRPRRQAVPLA